MFSGTDSKPNASSGGNRESDLSRPISHVAIAHQSDLFPVSSPCNNWGFQYHRASLGSMVQASLLSSQIS